MKIHLDDDSAWPLLANLLRKAGHDVQLPSDVGLAGAEDPVHLTRAISDDRICMTKNYDDFALLHTLVKQTHGKHPGILVVRQDSDPSRDLTPKGIVAAIRKLEATGVPIANEYIVLNQWR
jgi:predicted nuclease of predicted toxin-antitoxin system